MKHFIKRTIKKRYGKKIKHEYTYKSKVIHKSEYNKYIKDIYIPPAYDDVKISKDITEKVLAIGTDEKGRKQYIYNKAYVKKASEDKYKKLILFGNNYKRIMNSVNKDMISFNDSKDKQIAMILKIIDDCNFRIGNEKYSKENKSYGVCTLLNEHVKINNDGITIDFRGKKGVRNSCKVKNNRLKKNLRMRKKTHKKDDRVFSYRVNNNYYNVTASDVNKYLKKFGDFSAKNFRTWAANIDLIKELHKQSSNSLQKNLSESIGRVADKMHHSKSICRKNYINNDLIELYKNNNNIFTKIFKSTNKSDISEEFIKFLKDTYN
jgi:DNA topoisomerase I